jgi:L-galactose dehydrogenase
MIEGNLYGDMTQDIVTKMTVKALKSGINYIDTAPWYGQGVSEKRLGVALQNVPRNTYFMATKVL